MAAKKYNIQEFDSEEEYQLSQDEDTESTRPPLYPRQKKVLEFIEDYIGENDRSPTLTEIKTHMGVKTLSTVHWHLIQLEKKGYIERDKESKGIDLILTSGQFAGAVITIPLIGLVTAGQPIDAFEDHDQDPIPVPEQLIGKKDSKDLFCLRVRGDSMIDAYLLDGDIVVCQDTKGNASNGDMVVALLEDNTATLKKYYKKKSHIVLQPANPEYEPIKIKSVSVQGKVVAVMRKV